ncbi:hypothetical protein ACFL0B_10210 [Thermodesulfobacteriota bacterium]
MARKITKELTPEEMESMTSKKGKPTSSNQKPSEGKKRKMIRFDFAPNATPEEIAKGINDLVKKHRKGSEPEKP